MCQTIHRRIKKMSDSLLTWEDVLKREDLVGGDIQWCENGTLFRGPLNKIERHDEEIHFSSPWFAQKKESGWEYDPKAKLDTAVFCENRPKETEDGNIQTTLFFHLSCVFTVTIFPKGKNLDSHQVRGSVPV